MEIRRVGKIALKPSGEMKQTAHGRVAPKRVARGWMFGGLELRTFAAGHAEYECRGQLECTMDDHWKGMIG